MSASQNPKGFEEYLTPSGLNAPNQQTSTATSPSYTTSSSTNPASSSSAAVDPSYYTSTTTTSSTSGPGASQTNYGSSSSATAAHTGTGVSSRPEDLNREYSYGVTPAALKSENAHQWSDQVISDIQHVDPVVPGRGNATGSNVASQTTPGNTTTSTIVDTANQAATQAKNTVAGAYNAAANAFSGTNTTSMQGTIGSNTGPTATEKISQAASSGVAAVSNIAGSAYNTVANTLSQNTNPQTTANASGTVPGVVRESQDRAHISPEASAVPSAVLQKGQMEDELLSTVTTSPVTAGATNPIMDRLTDAFQSTGLTGTTSAQTTTSSVPGIVQDSQARARQPAEASGVPSVVVHKQAFENELLSEVNTTPAYNSTSQTAANYAGQAKDAIVGVANPVVDRLTSAIQGTGLAGTASAQTTTSTVPEIVQDSQVRAHRPAEASGVPSAVVQKQAFENELLNEVNTTPAYNSTSQTAANYAGQARDAIVGVANPVVNSLTSALQSTGLTGTTSAQTTTSTVPEIVQDSQARAHQPAEASGIPSAVVHKQAFENELLSEVNTTPAHDSTSQTAANYAGQAKDAIVGGAQYVQANSGPVQSAFGTVLQAAASTAAMLANQAREGAAAIYNSAGHPVNQSTDSTAYDDAAIGRAQSTATDTPAVVAESQMAAGFGKEASGVPSAVAQKQVVEDELLSKVDIAPAAAGSTRPGAQAMSTSELISKVPGGF